MYKKIQNYKVSTYVRLGIVNAVFVQKNNHEYLRWLKKQCNEKKIKIIYDLWVSRILIAQRDGGDIEGARKCERSAIENADLCLVLTKQYEDYYHKEINLSRKMSIILPMMVTEEWLSPLPPKKVTNKKKFIVGYWGSYLKQHGVDMLVKAAKELENNNDGIEFRFYGDYKNDMTSKIFDNIGTNIKVYGRLKTIKELVSAVDEINLGVGHLKKMHDAHLVFPNKVYEGLARGKPMISIDVPSMYDEFISKDCNKSPIVFYSGDVDDLVRKILEIEKDKNIYDSKVLNSRKMIEQSHSPDTVKHLLDKVI